MTRLDQFVFTFLNLKVMLDWGPKIAEGFVLTVELAILVVLAGLAAGLALAIIRLSGWRVLVWPIVFAVDALRAIPPLLIMILLFFGLPSAGIELSGFMATWLALSAVLAAFAEEIFWASIRAVPTGQTEAARALGLGFFRILYLIVLPQAMRMAIPPLTNRTIAITKGTAFGSVVGLSEILGASQSAVAFSANPSPLILGALAYVVLFAPVVAFARWLERRFARA
jgi:polar amino acid transport system permease protein